MAPFQAKIGCKTPRKRENKIDIPFRSIPNLRVMENSKKIAKIFKKLRNNTMASFQAKTGLKMPRKREYKQYRSVSSYPTQNIKLKKNSKKV